MSDLGLIDAVKAGDYATAQMLIKKGGDLNQGDEQGWTPLNFAAGKGDLSLVTLLVENGADVFKVGRDQRTPCMIALAAGRVSVVKYLREAQEKYSGSKPTPTRDYCKAYHLGELRKYPAWSESKINWKEQPDDSNVASDGGFTDDKIVFVHQDFSVTESMWRHENVIFNRVDSDWEKFCANDLGFKVPDELDLIVPNPE
jgi:ankyrin repeat protein